MSREPDYALRSAVVIALQSSGRALTFRGIQALTWHTNWTLRMALDYLIQAGIISKRGKSGVACTYSLTGREFDSGKRREFDASGLARVWG